MKELTQDELKNLEVIFTFARQAVVGDKKRLIDVINFEQALFEKLTTKEEIKPETTQNIKEQTQL